MENEKLSLEKCKKCGACGVVERSQREEDGPFEENLVMYYKCEACHHAWSEIVDTRRGPGVIEAPQKT